MRQYEQSFRLLEDTRTEEEVLHQHKVVEEMQRRNLENFQITLTAKQRVEYTPRELTRIELDDGWYCQITDNKLDGRHAVLTVHGCPGDHREWAGLEHQMQSSCRWINLVVPGFDGEDERRGNYSGSMKDFSELIVRLMNKLQLKRIVFCGHSMGSIFMTYFVTHYQRYIEGVVSITGIVDTWYVGLLGFYRTIVVSPGMNNMTDDRNERLNDDGFRKRLKQVVEQQGKLIHFGPVQIPVLTESEICSYIKLLNSANTGLSEQFQLNRKMALEVPKVYIFGKIDPLENNHLTEEMYYRRCYLHPTNKLLESKLQLVQFDLLKRCHEIGVKLNLSNVQSNFCWMFEQTGHNAHKRRPKEIAKILQAYFILLDELQRAEALQQTKL